MSHTLSLSLAYLQGVAAIEEDIGYGDGNSVAGIVTGVDTFFLLFAVSLC